MILPVGTDRRLRRLPVINTALIVVNLLLALYTLVIRPLQHETPLNQYMLLPVDPHWYQFFTYQFLHHNWEHVLWNVLFLFVFGNSLEDRLGRTAYLAFYLSGGVIAGLGQMAMGDDVHVLGASGAVSAVAGAYFALFPLSRVVITFLFIYFFEVPAMIIIVVFFALHVGTQMFGGSGVAYLAHTCGALVGFAVALGLLYWRVLPREVYDFMSLADRWNRRRQMRSATRGGQSPWLADAGTTADPAESTSRVDVMRRAIDKALADRDPDRALDTYERLLADHPAQVMSRDSQFDLANHAMQHARHGTAATAYELFIKAYPDDPQADEVRVMLGLVYARYLDRPDAARPHLERAVDRLDDEKHHQLAAQLLKEISDTLK